MRFPTRRSRVLQPDLNRSYECWREQPIRGGLGCGVRRPRKERTARVRPAEAWLCGSLCTCQMLCHNRHRQQQVIDVADVGENSGIAGAQLVELRGGIGLHDGEAPAVLAIRNRRKDQHAAIFQRTPPL